MDSNGIIGTIRAVCVRLLAMLLYENNNMEKGMTSMDSAFLISVPSPW